MKLIPTRCARWHLFVLWHGANGETCEFTHTHTPKHINTPIYVDLINLIWPFNLLFGLDRILTAWCRGIKNGGPHKRAQGRAQEIPYHHIYIYIYCKFASILMDIKLYSHMHMWLNSFLNKSSINKSISALTQDPRKNAQDKICQGGSRSRSLSSTPSNESEEPATWFLAFLLWHKDS